MLVDIILTTPVDLEGYMEDMYSLLESYTTNEERTSLWELAHGVFRKDPANFFGRYYTLFKPLLKEYNNTDSISPVVKDTWNWLYPNERNQNYYHFRYRNDSIKPPVPKLTVGFAPGWFASAMQLTITHTGTVVARRKKTFNFPIAVADKKFLMALSRITEMIAEVVAAYLVFPLLGNRSIYLKGERRDFPALLGPIEKVAQRLFDKTSWALNYDTWMEHPSFTYVLEADINREYSSLLKELVVNDEVDLEYWYCTLLKLLQNWIILRREELTALQDLIATFPPNWKDLVHEVASIPKYRAEIYLVLA